MVNYLCGEHSDFVVGQTIVIDGGYTLSSITVDAHLKAIATPPTAPKRA
jgi:hypothetical protein